MGAPDLLDRLTAAGLRLKADGDRLVITPRARLSDELRDLIRTNKPALIEALRDAPIDPLVASALAKLVIDQALRRSVVAEPDRNRGYRVGIAIRRDGGGYATAVLSVPRSDGFDLLEALQRADA